jgi:ubiquinone/menaquinone biosynthesis C-methylase UbiE
MSGYERPLLPRYLNLAAGSDYKEGWLNLDIAPFPGYPPPDVLWDARSHKLPFLDSTIDGVVAGYLLIHMGHMLHHGPLLDEIHRVLKPGGVLQVGEVDMALVMPRWLADPSSVALSELIWGEQGHHEGRPELDCIQDTDHHCAGYTEATLRALLEQHGFGEIQRVKLHAPEVWMELTLNATAVK